MYLIICVLQLTRLKFEKTAPILENQVKLQVLVFNIVWVGGGVRQVKLYSPLTCAQKRQKCKFVPRRLSMIVGAIEKNRKD